MDSFSFWMAGRLSGGGGPGWNYQQFNVTAYANPAMKVRFGFMVGSAAGLYTIGSWNVDDVLVASLPCP